MPIVLVLENDEPFTELELDVNEIYELSLHPDTTTHDWCIDGTYYTIFYTLNEYNSWMYNFPPPLDMVTYSRVVIVSSNGSIVCSPVPDEMDINDLSASHWDEIESEISGIESSDSNEEHLPESRDDMYENFYETPYDSDREMSEEDYVSE